MGVEVTPERLRVVLRRGDAILASWTTERRETAQLGNQLRECFARGLHRRWRRPAVTIALGVPAVRRKVLRGLPPVADHLLLEHMVRQGAARFFLGSPTDVVIAAVAHGADVIAETFDRATVETCVLAARAARVRLTIVSVGSAESLVSAMPEVDPSLAVAFAAAGALKPNIPAVHDSGASDASIPRWRAIAAGTAAVLGALSLAASPVLAARLTASRASEELQELAAAYRSAVAAQRDIARLSGLIAGIEAGAAGETQAATLARLTTALPLDAALAAITVDTTGATLVVVADEMVRVLASFDTIQAVASARIVGSVTRERVADLDLERATLRLDWRTPP